MRAAEAHQYREQLSQLSSVIPGEVQQLNRMPVTQVPGGYVNPNVQSWYYQKAFEPEFKKSWASQAYPDLFGADGIYPLAYEQCYEECMADGVCWC